MRVALYRNKSSNFQKLINIVVEPEEAAKAGAKWGTHASPAYVWFEPENDQVVIAFDQKNVPLSKVVVGKVGNHTDRDTAALGKTISPLNKSDPGRSVAFMLHSLGLDDTLQEFSRHPIDCTVADGRIMLKIEHIRLLGAARVERERIAEAGRLAKMAQRASRDTSSPASTAEEVTDTPPAKPAPSAPLAAVDMNLLMQLAQNFLDANPSMKIITMANRKIAFVAV